MRRALAIASLLLIAALAAFVQPPKTPRQPTLVAHVTPTTVYFVYGVSGTGGPDSLITTGSGAAPFVRRTAGTSKVDSVGVPRPAMGASVAETISVVAKKLGALSGSSAPKSLSYTEPIVVPTPTVDTVYIRPPGPLSMLGTTNQHFCAILHFTDGSSALASNSTGSDCDQHLAAYQMGA